MSLTESQVERFSRQLLLDEIGGRGQARLLEARVLVLGAGGLGCPSLTYLAAAGVGHLTVVDPDLVEPSNLHRQPLHRLEDVGRPKVIRVAEALRAAYPDTVVDPIEGRFDADTAVALLAGHDLLVDGTDCFETRFLANDVAVAEGVPLVHGAVLGFEGRVLVVGAGAGAEAGAGAGGCYRCLFEAPPPPGEIPSCAQAGVLGAVCGVIGSVMATEAIKVLLGAGDILSGTLFVWDALRARARRVPLPKRADCPACGTRPEARA